MLGNSAYFYGARFLIVNLYAYFIAHRGIKQLCQLFRNHRTVRIDKGKLFARCAAAEIYHAFKYRAVLGNRHIRLHICPVKAGGILLYQRRSALRAFFIGDKFVIKRLSVLLRKIVLNSYITAVLINLAILKTYYVRYRVF